MHDDGELSADRNTGGLEAPSALDTQSPCLQCRPALDPAQYRVPGLKQKRSHLAITAFGDVPFMVNRT